MFLEHYGLKEQPFGVSPDPRFLFLSPTHREALAALHCGVSSGRGFMALIAQPGMGKTTLLVQLLQSLRTSARTVFLFQMQASPRDLLRNLLADLGISCDDGDFVRIHSRLNEILLAERHAGRRFVLVIDEAQSLDPAVLEIVRMLSNFETPQDKLMQIILAGQPQLAAKLAAPGMVQLRQRLAMVARLKPLGFQETESYIQHRLQVAGRDESPALFTPAALQLIARHSAGIPRNINMLCFNALSLGCAMRQRRVDEEIVLEVLADQDLRSIALEPFARSGSSRVAAATSSSTPQRSSRHSFQRWAPKFVFACALAAAAAMFTFAPSHKGAADKRPVQRVESSQHDLQEVPSAAGDSSSAGEGESRRQNVAHKSTRSVPEEPNTEAHSNPVAENASQAASLPSEP